MLNILNLTKLKSLSSNFSFGSNEIFKDANITLNKGEIIGIIGKTGVGKTTFL